MQKELIHKYLEGTATDEERTEVELWYASIQLPLRKSNDHNAVRSRIYARIEKAKYHDDGIRKYRWQNWRLFSAAAAIVLVAGSVFLMFNNSQKSGRNALSGNSVLGYDIAPGGDQAILTLADGHQISLDTVAEGKLKASSGVQISKAKGTILYSPTNENGSAERYNVLSTPKGAKFKLILPDGSNVWLNALSSIRYPEVFSGTGRYVEVKGEAYFEVAHLEAKDKKSRVPFIVQAGSEKIEVLGTHFNVHYYQDEPERLTTLLEGAVKVSSHSKSVLLSPGQAAGQEIGNQELFRLDNVNTDLAIAWKNDEFRVRNSTVPQIMKQISRWYDVEVVYQGAPPKDRFSGTISRQETLSHVLEILERGGIKLKLNERKITVY